MPLTKIQLIDEAIAQAGLDSGFRPKGRMWLNLAIEKLSVRYNYPQTRVQNYDTPFVAGQSAYNLPADFSHMDTMYYIDSNGNQGHPISVREAYSWEPSQTNGRGFPSIATIDLEDGKVRFNSAPETTSGEKYRMSYFRKPTTYSLTDSDDSTVPEFPDQWSLMEEMKAMAYEFKEDEREDKKKREAVVSSQTFQRNMAQSDANSKIQLNKEVHRGRQRRR